MKKISIIVLFAFILSSVAYGAGTESRRTATRGVRWLSGSLRPPLLFESKTEARRRLNSLLSFIKNEDGIAKDIEDNILEGKLKIKDLEILIETRSYRDEAAMAALKVIDRLGQLRLDKIDPDRKQVVGVLKKALINRGLPVLLYAAQLAGKIGPSAKEIAPILMKIINNNVISDDSLSNEAVRAIDRIYPEGDEAIPFLVEGLEGRLSDFREYCYRSLKKRRLLTLQYKVRKYITDMRFGNKKEKTEQDLVKFGLPAVPYLLEDTLGIGIIAKIGKRSRSYVLKALHDERPIVRRCAIGAICKLEPEKNETITVLKQMLKDENPYVSYEAACELCNIVKLLSNEDEKKDIRDNIVEYLLECNLIDQRPEPLVATLEFLPYDNRIELVINIFKGGYCLQLERYKIPQSIRLAGLIEKTEKEIPTLRRLLKHKIDSIRQEAIWISGIMGPKAKETMPELIEALKDRNAMTCGMALNAIAGMIEEKEAESSINAIAQYALRYRSDVYRDKAPSVRMRAAWVLGMFGIRAKEAMPGLVSALEDEKMVQEEAAKSIGKMVSIAEPAIPALVKAAEFGNSFAIETLGKIGPMAKKAMPVLKRALKSNKPAMVASAKKAIPLIEPRAASVKDRGTYVKSPLSSLEIVEEFTGIAITGGFVRDKAYLIKSGKLPKGRGMGYILAAKDAGPETLECVLNAYYKEGGFLGIVTGEGGSGSHLAQNIIGDMPGIVYIAGIGEENYLKIKPGDILELDENTVRILSKRRILRLSNKLPRNRPAILGL